MENHSKEVCVVGLTERRVQSVEDLLRVMDKGTRLRKTGSTAANIDSSRSHAILQISLKEKENKHDRGKFSFIDLAGTWCSERWCLSILHNFTTSSSLKNQ